MLMCGLVGIGKLHQITRGKSSGEAQVELHLITDTVPSFWLVM
jgi:hypothetical protein